MSTLVKIIVTTLLSLSLFSCNFNLNSGVNGTGKVSIENRPVTEAFYAIKAAEGLNVILTQSNTESITVEADENLQELIITEVLDGVLKIHTKANIGSSTSKKILVNFKAITQITTTSGSMVSATNTLSADKLSLKSTSGSRLELDLNAAVITCKATSGSRMRLSGKTKSIIAEASSGSRIIAEDLTGESAEVKASSGARTIVNATKTLVAKATSGGSVTYYGEPASIEKNDTVSGSISKG